MKESLAFKKREATHQAEIERRHKLNAWKEGHGNKHVGPTVNEKAFAICKRCNGYASILYHNDKYNFAGTAISQYCPVLEDLL